MAKIRKQIISPGVRFAASSRGPYASRIGQAAYAKTFGIGKAQTNFEAFCCVDGVIKALVKGNDLNTVRFRNAASQTVDDFEAVTWTTRPHEIRVGELARRVENLINREEQIVNDLRNWNGSFNQTYSTVDFTGIGDLISYQLDNLGALPSQQLRWHMELRTVSGAGGDIDLRLNDGVSNKVTTITPTTTSTRFTSDLHTMDAGATRTQLQFRSAGFSGTLEILNITLELLTNSTNKNPAMHTPAGQPTGPEELDEPSFDAQGTWVTPAGHQITGGQLVITNAATGSKTLQEDVVIEGINYLIEMEIKSITEGSLRFEIANEVVGLYNTPGVYTYTLLSGDAVPGRFAIRCSGTTTAKVNYASVKVIDLGAHIDGVQYFNYENGNTVGAGNVVQEAKGAEITGWRALIDASAGDDASDIFTLSNIPDAEGTWHVDLWVSENTVAADQLVFGTSASGTGEMYTNQQSLGCDDGTSATVVGSVLTTLNNQYRGAIDFKTGNNKVVGVRDVEGAGTFTFSTPNAYDGDFAQIGFNVATGRTSAIRLRELKGYHRSQGQQWIEDNL